MSALGYAWKVGVNFFNFAVVWYVLEQVHTRPEAVILPILGVLYVTIRLVGIGTWHSSVVLGTALDGLERRLARMAGEYLEEEPEYVRANREKLDKFQTDMHIDSFGLGVVGLLCLWKFLVAVGIF